MVEGSNPSEPVAPRALTSGWKDEVVALTKSFDVLKHELVPRHEILPTKEYKELLAKYGARAEQLPRILETDPAARAVGGKAGQILKITRKSPTAGEAIAFRVVVEA